MSTATEAPREWPCTNEEYHGTSEYVGHSSLDVFRESRKEYRAVFVTKTKPPRAPTEEMVIGTRLHTLVFEPELFEASYCLEPPIAPDGKPWDRRYKEHKVAWAEFLASVGGRTPIEGDEFYHLHAMARAIEESPTAGPLLREDGPVEHSIVWPHETGLMLKSRRDKVIDGLILDLKTCAEVSPRAFSRTSNNFGYHRQSALYMFGEHELTGHVPRMAFVCVSKKTFEVAVYELSMKAVDLGHRQNEKALAQLAECYRTNDWLATHERQITTLDLPRYADFEDEWEVTSGD